MKKNLLGDVFGYKPQSEPVAATTPPPALTPAPKQKYDRENVSAEVAAQAQAMVWGNGNVPPPKAPTAKQADKGQAPAMSNQEGWGKI